jgi:hypothetical protein
METQASPNGRDNLAYATWASAKSLLEAKNERLGPSYIHGDGSPLKDRASHA